MRFSSHLAVALLSLSGVSLAAPIDSTKRAAASVLTSQSYSDFQVSDGVAGNALAEVNAKFPVCILRITCSLLKSPTNSPSRSIPQTLLTSPPPTLPSLPRPHKYPKTRRPAPVASMMRLRPQVVPAVLPVLLYRLEKLRTRCWSCRRMSWELWLRLRKEILRVEAVWRLSRRSWPRMWRWMLRRMDRQAHLWTFQAQIEGSPLFWIAGVRYRVWNCWLYSEMLSLEQTFNACLFVNSAVIANGKSKSANIHAHNSHKIGYILWSFGYMRGKPNQAIEPVDILLHVWLVAWFGVL